MRHNLQARLQGIGMTSQRTRDRLVQRLREEGITNQQVLEVIRSTPRHIFVDEALASRSYEDTALPIGHGQTISQPLIVAFIAVGILVGPSVLGWVSANDQIDLLAKFGITLLLFTVGLKMHLRTLARPQVWAVSTLHMVVTVLVLAAAAFAVARGGLFAGLDTRQALL